MVWNEVKVLGRKNQYSAIVPIVKSIKNIPKLFIHSKEDEQIPFAEGQLVYKNALTPKAFFVYNGNHLQALRVDPSGVLKEIDKLIGE